MRKLISLLTLSLTASFAQANQVVTVPELEGGFTASIGTFYATPSTSNNNNSNFQSGTMQANPNNPDNQFGTQGSIGYMFDKSANGVEISNRRMY